MWRKVMLTRFDVHGARQDKAIAPRGDPVPCGDAIPEEAPEWRLDDLKPSLALDR